MSKQKPKKPALSEEERRARMAALTSDVAAVNLLDGRTMPSPTATPTADAPVSPAAPAEPTQAASSPAPAAPTLTPAPQHDVAGEVMVPAEIPVGGIEQEGEKSAASTQVASPMSKPALPPEPVLVPAPVVVASTAGPQDEAEAADRGGEGVSEEAAPVGQPGELNIAGLFTRSSEKKDTTLRITAGHQQFFNQLGLVLGNGASAPDIIHNILMQFRQQHEAALAKQVKKALAKQFK